MNFLAAHNEEKRREIEAARDRAIAARGSRPDRPLGAYALPAFERRVVEALSARWGKGALEPQFDLMERARHGGDVAVRFPQLLREGGPKVFIRDHQPWIVEVLKGADFADAVASVETAGMYVNIRLTDRWLLDAAQQAADLGESFGLSDAMRERVAVVDYSSPNVAKTLHAGHIRSTIVGHVLSNLYEACGALTHRVNHINDFGGFGFTLEGYARFGETLKERPDENDRLLEIYRIRRTVERAVETGAPLDALAEADRALIARYFPDAATTEDLARAFAAFTAASDARFERLESGAEREVALWKEMVAWSLADFDRFYDSLNIRFDLVVGESFYFAAGDALVERFLAEGKAVVFTPQLAAAAIARIDARLARDEIARPERDTLAAAAEKDVGAAVIQLDRDERMVVRRADGRSIYATRDLGAIALRRELFAMDMSAYVVGQEQQVHFDRLFRAAAVTGLATPEEVQFLHLYFGFYVDAKSGKKLSSRDSVANVAQLLAESRAYFRSRITERADRPDADLDQAARELAVGSLVFNDLKQDIKGSIEVDATDMAATIAGFEKSGAAYVVYAACRARSILRRYGKRPAPASEIAAFALGDQEAQLILKLQQIPQKIAASAKGSNPSLLVRHLLEIATVYNSYYMNAPVIVAGEADPARLVITHATQEALAAGLLVCHVTCPEAI